MFFQYIQDVDNVDVAFVFQRKTSPHHIFSKVGDAKALWSNKFEAYAAKQASNPFSDKYVGPAKIDKNDPNKKKTQRTKHFFYEWLCRSVYTLIKILHVKCLHIYRYR